MLHWTLDCDRQQSHENHTPAASIERARQLLGTMYRNAHLFTTQADVTARTDKAGGCRITQRPPSKQASDEPLTHDRRKRYLIPDGTPCEFLHALGVMAADGTVRKSKSKKFRQINRYLEFVEDVYGQLPQEGRLEVIDFGCGLSYLTFALHHLLTLIHRRDVRIRGIDRNETVITRCRQISEELSLPGIEFTCGQIDALPVEAPVDLVVSLHACDTATDDALAQAVRHQARVILAAPCCQHQLFTQLDSDPLALLTRHGILKERFAALATDALRAALLEQQGYRAQVIEFIDTEHTPKNLLLRAVHREQGAADPALAERIESFKQLLGVSAIRLEQLLAGEQATSVP
jgi:SAM-dependent methyltransferase